MTVRPKEPRVPKPNDSECGFNAKSKTWAMGDCRIAYRKRGSVKPACRAEYGRRYCRWAEMARALYARQQEAE